MRKDPTKFRERFKRWKNGERVYDKGTPVTQPQDKMDSLLDAGYQGPWGTYGYTTDDVSRRIQQRTQAKNNHIADRLQAGADAIMLGTGLVPGGLIPSSAYFGARGVGNIAQGDYIGGAIDAGLSLVGPAVHLNRQMHKPSNLKSYFESNPLVLRKYDLSQLPEGELLTRFWNEDVVPRMKKALKDDGTIKASGVNKLFNNDFVRTRRIRIGEAPTNLRGKGYSSGTNDIAFNTNSNLWKDPDLRYGALAHELHHSQRANLDRNKLLYAEQSGEYTQAEQDALNDAYNFSDEFITKYSPSQLQEKGAVNTQTRAAISRMNGGVVGKQLNKAIDAMPEKSIKKIMSDSSAYGKDFVKSSKFDIKKVNKALKQVGQIKLRPLLLAKDGKDGGPLDGVTGESQTINQETQRAYNFINTYLKSEGFKQRFENNYRYAFAANPIPTFKAPKVIYRDSVSPYAEPVKRTIFIPTNKETNKLRLNGRDPYEVYNTHDFTDFPYQGTVTHEMAHVLDYDMAQKMQPKHWYTKLFMPVSRMYSAAYEQLTPKTKEGKLNDHDKQRSENYADLIEFRQLLLDNGIYDSTKKNNPFTKEHLKSAKEKLKDIFVRPFNTFSDEELINIMNTVADARVKKVNLSNVESYNGLLLAQNGKDPTYNTQQSHLPEVTISAKRTNYTPTYGYWDSLGQQWSTFNNLGQREYRGAGWEPDVVLKTPLEYENYRQALWKKSDPNRTFEFSDLIRDIVYSAVSAKGYDEAFDFVLHPINKFILTSRSPLAQYIRYGVGKVNGYITGQKVNLPTMYRAIKEIPKITNNKVLISNPNNRFAFLNGEESPLITNMTTDLQVASHGSGDWDDAMVMAFPGEQLLGKNVVSTRPSDTFIYGQKLRVPRSKVTMISGDNNELLWALRNGIKSTPASDLQKAYEAVKNEGRTAQFSTKSGRTFNIRKENWTPYADAKVKTIRENFKSPTLRDYEFMDYVFRPQYTSDVIPYVPKLTESAIAQYPQLGDWYGNVTRRRYVTDPKRWANVMYDPATTVESEFRKTMGIDLKKDLPNDGYNTYRYLGYGPDISNIDYTY